MLDKKEKEMRIKDFEEELKDLYGYDKFDKFTKDKIITHLFGDYESRPDSKFKVVYRWNPDIKNTPMQRFNMLWVWPLYMLTVAPYNYITKGDTGVERESKLGKLLNKLVGYY